MDLGWFLHLLSNISDDIPEDWYFKGANMDVLNLNAFFMQFMLSQSVESWICWQRSTSYRLCSTEQSNVRHFRWSQYLDLTTRFSWLRLLVIWFQLQTNLSFWKHTCCCRWRWNFIPSFCSVVCGTDEKRNDNALALACEFYPGCVDACRRFFLLITIDFFGLMRHRGENPRVVCFSFIAVVGVVYGDSVQTESSLVPMT